MKTKHTPGPWVSKVHNKGPYFSEVEVWHENYGLLARMSDNSSIWNSEKKEDVAIDALNQNKANAVLMAASPDMLAELINQRQRLKEMLDDEIMPVTDSALRIQLHKMVARLTVAIRKATQ